MNEPSDCSASRRRLLEAGAALGTAGLTGLAGCSSVGDIAGVGGGGNDGDAGSDDTPEYATWLPAPGRVLLDPADAEDEQDAVLRSYYPFSARNWPDVGARLEATGVEAEGYFAADEDDFVTEYEDGHVHPVLPLGPRDAGLEVASNRGISVLETGMDDAAIVEAFERYETVSEPFERVGEYEGYELLALPDSPWTVGVRDGAVVEGFQSAGFQTPILRDPRAVVEAVVDARNGEDRYVEANDALGAMVSHLGAGTYVDGNTYSRALRGSIDGSGGNATGDPDTGTPEPEPEPLATGTATTLGAGRTTARFVAVFESAEVASAENLSTERRERPFEDWEDVETRTDGRAVVVEGTREYDLAG